MASTSVKKTNSTIYTPDGVSGPVSVFIFYPGIPVTCGGNTLNLPKGTLTGESYMPPGVKAGVPDWFDKYVIVFPHLHTTAFGLIKSELDSVLTSKNLTIKHLNLGVFSGSGGKFVTADLKLTTFLIMDPYVSGTATNAKTVLDGGGKVFAFYAPAAWGGDAVYPSKSGGGMKSVVKLLKEEDWGEINNSTYAKFGFPPLGGRGGGCGQTNWHMLMPELLLKYFKSKIEQAQGEQAPSTPVVNNSTNNNTGQNTNPPKPTPEEDAKKKKEAEEAERKKKLAKEPEAVNSKIILKKVSGPGELVGVTEADIARGSVNFKGLQFTEPGTYVISVSGTSTQLLPTSFTVSVLPSEEIVEQPPSGNEEAPIPGTRPIIAQIDEPKIKIEPMTYVATDDQPNKETSGSLGLLPFVYYGKFQIQPSDIQRLGIFYDEFVPKCVMTFQDTMGLVNSPETSPTANSTIEVFLNSGSAELKPIHLKFLIDQKKDNKNGTITIFGKLDLKDFYKISYSSYTGTSFQTLRTISKELGLGFNSNIVETNDSMRWLRSGENFETFIRSIITKSYISDTSFMVGYIDYYYCFNYVDVEKEYNRQNTTDVGIISTGVSYVAAKTDDQKTSRLILTNDKAANSSPFYFSKFTFINNATIQITNEGVTTDTKAYDRNKKNFLKFKVDSLSSSDDKLKTLRSEDDINTNFRTEFTGKMDTDNVHENYLYAITQNKRNLINLCNIMADLILPIPNFNIYKFQKISVVFTNDKSTPTEPDIIMTRYTGDWIIIDIGFSYQRSALVQTVRIARKELTKTEKEIKTETTIQDNTQNSEINENNDPEAKNPVPNSIYEIGQEVYIEQNGRLYILTIENVSENGIEISGKIKKAGFGVPADYNIYTPGVPQIKPAPEEQDLSKWLIPQPEVPATPPGGSGGGQPSPGLVELGKFGVNKALENVECGKASPNTLDKIYPKSVKWGGTQPVVAPATSLPTVSVNLGSKPEVTRVTTLATYQQFIQAADSLVNTMIPGASKQVKKRIVTSALTVGIREQGSEGKIKGFNNNLTGVESSGFKVFSASDVNGKVKATEGGTGIQKYYYSFSSLKVGLIPLVSNIIQRNMFAQTDDPNEWGWRYYRDWNGFGARTLPSYKTGSLSDCQLISGSEYTYKTALAAVNSYSSFK
jgi:hypothetical protein